MNSERRSIFTLAAGRRAKWVVLGIWLLGMFISFGANLPGKFTDAEDNESTSFLPGDAESTKVLSAAEELQGGELAPAVILYRRESGLTPADRQKIISDVGRLTEERFPAVVADGATAASGGKEGGADSAGGGGQAPAGGAQPEGCAGPTTPIQGQPGDYSPFVGPICSEDGKAAIITAYLKGDGEADSLLDPIQFWRDTVSDPGGGLEVKLTGGAGYAADAIEVFEGINGTLLLAALSLVIVLLILIYRSPIFLFIPLLAVIFAELLARSIGYGISELGVIINGQSSSIMSVLVLGAGTDYALLIVSRYREELHHTLDRHEAMAAAMRSAGPAVFASAATVIAALLCLTIAKVNGTAGLGPIGALGVGCAAISMLTLLPALLTIYGRRAFWPFVPHTESWTVPDNVGQSGLGKRIIAGSSFTALVPVAFACLLFPFFLIGWLIKTVVFLVTLGKVRIPNLALDPLDRAIFKPYEVRRTKHEKVADATHGFWKRVGDRVAAQPARVMISSLVVLLVMCAGLAFFSTDLTTNDSYRTSVESVEGQDLLAKSFPAGASAPADVIVPPGGDVQAVTAALEDTDGIEAVSPPVAEGEQGTLVQADPDSEALLHRGLRPDRTDQGCRLGRSGGHRGGRTECRGVRRARGRRLGLHRDPADRAHRGVPDPRPAPAGRGGAAHPDRHGDPELPGRTRRRLPGLRPGLRLPRIGPVTAAVRLRVPGGPGRRLQHLPDGPCPGGDAQARHPRGDAARAGRNRRGDHQRRHRAGRHLLGAGGAAARVPDGNRLRGGLRGTARHLPGAQRARPVNRVQAGAEDLVALAAGEDRRRGRRARADARHLVVL